MRSSIIGASRQSPAELIGAYIACDRYLENSGLPHVIVRPNFFLQNIAESVIPSVDASGNFFVNAGEARISMIDTRDVGAVAAAVLTEPGHAGAHYDVAGPEALSHADVAGKLTRALGRQITYVDAPDKAVRDALLGAGLSTWFADALVGLYQDYRRSGTGGYAAQVTDTIERFTGRPARSLDDLLVEIAPDQSESGRSGRSLRPGTGELAVNLIVQLVPESVEGVPFAVNGPCQPAFGAFIGDGFGEVGHVVGPDPGWQWIDADEV